MQEDKIKIADKSKLVTLIFAGLWKQVHELCSSFFLLPPPPNLSVFLHPGFKTKIANVTVV